MTAARPNHIWGIDITYIRLTHGWLYLTAVLDWYSRYVISWALSQTLEMDFELTAVDNALFQAKPEIWNSDQGSHFTNPKTLERLQREEIQISMDGRGRARTMASADSCHLNLASRTGLLSSMMRGLPG